MEGLAAPGTVLQSAAHVMLSVPMDCPPLPQLAARRHLPRRGPSPRPALPRHRRLPHSVSAAQGAAPATRVPPANSAAACHQLQSLAACSPANRPDPPLHCASPHSCNLPAGCPADPTWVQVRSRLDQFGLYPTVTDTTLPFGEGVTTFLSFSPALVAGLVYDPADPMWADNDRSKKACAWWFFSSG